MTTISSLGAGYNPAPAGQDQEPEAGAVSGKPSLADLGLEKLHADLARYAPQAASQGQGEVAQVGTLGPPVLEPSSRVFNVSEMVDFLRNLQSKIGDLLMKTAQAGVESARIKLKARSEEQQKLIQDWNKKSQAAAKKGKIAKIFGWVGKAAAFLGAAAGLLIAGVATALSGGAALPLLAVAAVGAASATLSLVSAISVECGGPEISFSNLFKNTVGRFLTDVCGVDSKLADKISKVAAGGVALTSPIMLLLEPSLLGDLAEGFAGLVGVNDQAAAYIGMAFAIVGALAVGVAMIAMTAGTSMLASGAQVAGSVLNSVLKIVNTAISTTATVVSGGAQVIGGAISIDRAKTVQESEHIQAQKKELQALMMKLQRMMEDGMEDMKKIVQDMDESVRAVSKMLAGASDSMGQVIQNMNSRAAV
ncbi:type III secretion system translocon subunit SctE [Alcaligenes sp. Marseille-Q7550]